ncbi:hypothetical protein DESUT3_34560 [Desulfuromonas versatilis]|uniref:Uncharacterized protein n=1 Tax=Desulfuromonas versatilis TaxID=2802975 RepID=A0ABM8I0D0_9BACT|nr:hypothetical protein [Desulfuromonas versatilis]BCR06387.1 hypothetical protein DESUT3_34560 [Desulfuromonas versatilis]
MGPDQIQSLVHEDQSLQVGSEVTAYWTAAGFTYHARARVAALTRKRVSVVLLENAGRHGEYPLGRTIELPRIADSSDWSSESCVRMWREPARIYG